MKQVFSGALCRLTEGEHIRLDDLRRSGSLSGCKSGSLRERPELQMSQGHLRNWILGLMHVFQVTTHYLVFWLHGRNKPLASKAVLVLFLLLTAKDIPSGSVRLSPRHQNIHRGAHTAQGKTPGKSSQLGASWCW